MRSANRSNQQTQKENYCPPRAIGLTVGVDPRRLSDFADELEADAFLAAENPATGKVKCFNPLDR